MTKSGYALSIRESSNRKGQHNEAITVRFSTRSFKEQIISYLDLNPPTTF